MKKITLMVLVFLVMLFVPFAGFSGGLPDDWKETEISDKVPLPYNIKIVPPAADLPEEIRSFSGRWEGMWEKGTNDELKTIFIVEEVVSIKKMKIIYATGRSRFGQGNYLLRTAKVSDDGKKLEIYIPRGRWPLTLILEMREDHKTIYAKGIGVNVIWTAEFKKIE